MGSLNAFGGKNILDMTLSKFFQQQPSRFKGSGISSGFTFAFEMTQSPVADLVPGGTNPRHNIKIGMRVLMNIFPTSGGNPRLNRNVVLAAFGIFSITAGKLSFSSLKIKIEDPSPIDVQIQTVIDSSIVPVIQRSLIGMPLPQLQRLFSTSLSANVRSGEVINGPALIIEANIAGHSNFRNADDPTATNIATLNTGSATNALMIGLASERTVNFLISELVEPFSYDFNSRKGIPGFTAGIDGTISASTPTITIRNGVGRASVEISIDLLGGIKGPIGGWAWLRIPVPSVSVTVTNSLSVVNGKGVVKLTGIANIILDLDFPGFLKPVESAINSLLSVVLTHFRGMIKDALSQVSFDIFEPPATIPGTNFGITLSFPRSGLSYRESSVQAIIRLRS